MVTEWSGDYKKQGGSNLDIALKVCEKMENHLTACVCSNDPDFITLCTGNTVNGTSYCGIRGRTWMFF